MKRSFCWLLFALGCAAALSAGAAATRCVDLAARILRHENILAATSVIAPPAGITPSYCLVNVTQEPAINIRVGLPLSAGDGGTGGAPRARAPGTARCRTRVAVATPAVWGELPAR